MLQLLDNEEMWTIKKILLGLIVVFSCANQAFSQQIPHFTQYMFNGIVQNPAKTLKASPVR